LAETLDETLVNRLKQAEKDVAREFGSLDPAVVREQFARVSSDLLRTATVTDFVPVLAQRDVRAALRRVASYE
jgi:hypothetical protein